MVFWKDRRYRHYIKQLPGAVWLYRTLRDSWIFIGRKRLARAYVVSYPKSGRTWLRVMLARYFSLYFGCPLDIDFERIIGRKGAPLLVFTHAQAATTIAQIHEAFRWRKVWWKDGKKLVLMFRDPRDVVVSLYYQEKFREHNYDGDLSSFVRHHAWGIDLLVDYMNLWLQALEENPANTCVIFYEDLHRNPCGVLARLVEFLEIKARPELIRESVEFARFENMRKMEARGEIGSFRLRPSDPSNPNAYKTRKGKIGGYREELSPQDIMYIDSRINSRLRSFFGQYKYCTLPRP